MLLGSRLSVALLSGLADFAIEIHFGREKPKRANAPIETVHKETQQGAYLVYQ